MAKKLPGVSILDRWYGKAKKPTSRCGVGLRFIVRVWDPIANGYGAMRSFATEEEARAHADAERSGLVLGTFTSRSAHLADLGPAYLAKLKDEGTTERHRAQVKQTIDGLIAASADDLKGPLFAPRVSRYIGTLTAKRHWQREGKPASQGLKRKVFIIARALVRYAIDTGVLVADPLAPLKVKKAPRHRKLTFTIEELGRLVADPPMRADGSGPKDVDWWLFATIGAYTGQRASIIKGLTWSMIDWKANAIRVPADLAGNRKGGRELRVPLQAEMRAILEPRMRVGAVPIVGSRLAEFPEGSVTHGFQDYCRRRGVDATGRGPHALRHSVAAILTAMGVSPYLVMDYLGHGTANVTKTYAANAVEYVDDVKGWDGQMRLRTAMAGHLAHANQ